MSSLIAQSWDETKMYLGSEFYRFTDQCKHIGLTVIRCNLCIGWCVRIPPFGKMDNNVGTSLWTPHCTKVFIQLLDLC